MTDSAEKQRSRTFLIILTSMVITLAVTLGLVLYSGHIEMEKTKAIVAEKAKLEKLNANLKNKFDSIASANALLFSQRQLTEAMVFRDSSLRSFPFEPGDVVRIKPDSALAVVEDVLIGGDEFTFHIKASVRYKDGHREIITPKLIFNNIKL